MISKEFKEYESIRYWMDALATRSEVTRTGYLGHFQAFCEAVKKTPDELIAQRRSDLKSDDLYVRHRIEMLLKKHIADLAKEGKSIGTQQNRYHAVRSFFRCHYASLEMLRSDAPTGESIGKEPADRMQIKRMIDISDPFKFRCLIAFLKDCGWRLSDVLRLKWGDINDMGDGFWNFKKVTKKRRVVANGFVGPETTELMMLYRRKRKDSGEKITPESPLFKSESGGFYKRVPWVSAKISKIAEMVEAKNVSAHSLRKYFQITLENPELHIQKSWIKQFMGKKIIGSDEPYVEHRTEKLFEAYKRAYDHLRVIQKVSLVELQKRQRIVEQLTDKLMRGEPFTEEDRANIKLYGIGLRESARRQTNGGCADSVNCGEEYQQIPEANVLEYLKAGWTIVHRLASGEVIVKR